MAEVELKFEISTNDVDKLQASNLLGDPKATIEQRSIYFDTEDHRLFGAGFTLRIRRSGEVRVQTVKATGANASLFARGEWETTVETDSPVIDHTNPLLNEFGPLASALSPLFEISIKRRVWNMVENGSMIEVVVDQGLVVEGGRHEPICELELELKDGDPNDLFLLARKVEAVAPMKFGVWSKAERGYRLLEAVHTVFNAEPVELERRAGSARAFQTIAQSCFRQFRLNETVLLRRRIPDALHQARVAIRRLRAAFSLFKPMLHGVEAHRITGEFRWLAGVLAEARNLDVLVPKARDGLRDELINAHEAVYDDAIQALSSARANALMLDFNEWLRCGTYLDAENNTGARKKPIDVFAVEALDKMRKNLKKHGRGLAHVDDEQRHKARKDAKKLRYAAEFFQSLFSEKQAEHRHKRFIKTMEVLQDKLGALNDLSTGPGVLEKYGLSDHPDAEAALSHAKKAVLIEEAQVALDHVLDAKRFWR